MNSRTYDIRGQDSNSALLPGSCAAVYAHFLMCFFFIFFRIGQPKFAKVIKTEEKGSDVNLAVHLLNDGYQGQYELAVIITNDSDLLSAIEIVQNELGLKVEILYPQKHPSRALQNEVLFLKKIRPGVIQTSQFPQILTDAKGSFYKPNNWYEVTGGSSQTKRTNLPPLHLPQNLGCTCLTSQKALARRSRRLRMG